MPKSSPFPGMDPYLEPEWDEVHARFAIYAADALQPQLSADLRARAERRVVVEDEEAASWSDRTIVPDTMVVELAEPGGGLAVAADVDVDTQPLILHLPQLEQPQTFLKIIDVANGNQVVTVIEFLSPFNKRPGDGKIKYEQKRKECVQAGVNYVEVDLTRAGRRELLVPEHHIPPLARTTYAVSVFRATRRDQVEFYPISLWRPLPTIAIPLRPADADVHLALQPLLEQILERGRFTLDYSRPCVPPLSEADAAELNRRLASASN